MLRICNKFVKLSIEIEPFVAHTPNLQTCRWRRKPRWLPTAKSKIFKIPVKPTIPAEDYDELKRLYNIYRTQIKSLRRYLTYKHSELLHKKQDDGEGAIMFERDFQDCMKLNDEWNAQQKVLREDRLAKELEAQIEYAKNRIVEVENKKKQLQVEMEEFVRSVKSQEDTFITPENIDAVIEKAIANPVDYNFALDLSGSKLLGRESKPEAEILEKQKVKA